MKPEGVRRFLQRASLVLISLCFVVLLPAAEGQIETYRVRRTDSPPALDGRLDDPCWQDALTLEDFGLLGRGKTKADIPPTRAWLAYDADYLYVAYFCGEPLAERLLLKAERHDDKTWMDDCVEMFFNPSGDRRRYVQIVVNAAGVSMDAFFDGGPPSMDMGYESGIETRTKINKDSWTLEARIPFARLPLAGPDKAWTFHLARTRARAGQHLTALKSPTVGFHDIARFDRLKGISLPERPVGLKQASLGSLHRGTNLAHGVLENWGNRPVTVTLSVRVAGIQKRSDRKIELKPGAAETFEIPWRLDASAVGRRVNLEVRDVKRLLHARSAEVRSLPEVFGDLARNAYAISDDDFVRLDVPVRIAEGTRDDVRLRWAAIDSKGREKVDGETVVRGPEAVIRLYWSRWRDGYYTLRLNLVEQGRSLADEERTVRLVPSPWGNIP